MGRFKIKEDGVWRKTAWKDEVDGLAGNGRTTETVKGNADKIGILNGIGEVKEKINVANIVDDLTTNDSAKVLSAKQGKILKDELTSHIDDDDNPHEVKAEQIEYDNTESELATTTVQGAIDEVNADLASHKTDYAPKVFYDGLMEISSTKGFVAYKDSTKQEFTQMYPDGLYRVFSDGTKKSYNYLTYVGQKTSDNEWFNFYEETVHGHWQTGGGWIEDSYEYVWAYNFGESMQLPSDALVDSTVFETSILLPAIFRYKKYDIILVPHMFFYPDYYKYVDPDPEEGGDGSNLYSLRPMYVDNNNLNSKIKIELRVTQKNEDTYYPYFNVKAYARVINDGVWMDNVDLELAKKMIHYQNCFVTGISFTYIITA